MRNPTPIDLPRVLAILVSLVLLGAAPVDYVQTLRLSQPLPTIEVPAFQLSTLAGDTIDSRQLSGHVVLLNFWATWCGPCKEEMPALDALRQHFQNQPFQMYAVTADTQRDAIRHFWRSGGFSIPVLLDTDDTLSQSMMVRHLPTTIVIERNGTIHSVAMGPRPWDGPEARALISQLLESP